MSSEHFLEILDANYSVKIVCRPHRVVCCGTCALDFAIVNQLRLDDEFLALPTTLAGPRHTYIKKFATNYFRNPTPVEHDTGVKMSPQMNEMHTSLLVGTGNSNITVHQHVTATAMNTFAGRYHTHFQACIDRLLEVILQAIPTYPGGKKKKASLKTCKACTRCHKQEQESGAAFSRCSRCKITFYCNKECQLADWKMGHQQMCSAPSAKKSPKHSSVSK